MAGRVGPGRGGVAGRVGCAVAGRVGRRGAGVNLEESCSGLENSCLHMEKCGKMLEKKNSIMAFCLALRLP